MQLTELIRSTAAVKRTKGYVLLVDGTHNEYGRWCKSLECEIVAIIGTPKVFKNPLGSLTIDYRDEWEI